MLPTFSDTLDTALVPAGRGAVPWPLTLFHLLLAVVTTMLLLLAARGRRRSGQHRLRAQHSAKTVEVAVRRRLRAPLRRLRSRRSFPARPQHFRALPLRGCSQRESSLGEVPSARADGEIIVAVLQIIDIRREEESALTPAGDALFAQRNVEDNPQIHCEPLRPALEKSDELDGPKTELHSRELPNNEDRTETDGLLSSECAATSESPLGLNVLFGSEPKTNTEAPCYSNLVAKARRRTYAEVVSSSFSDEFCETPPEGGSTLVEPTGVASPTKSAQHGVEATGVAAIGVHPLLSLIRRAQRLVRQACQRARQFFSFVVKKCLGVK